MSLQMIFIVCLLIVMFTVLICEWAQPAIVFFSVLVILMFSGILTIEEALDGFANEGVHTVGLLFIVAGAVQQSGLIDKIIKKRLQNNHNQTSPVIRFYLPVSIFSAFLNNTPIVATFTPIIKTWCEDHGIAPSKFLIPLSYVTILGGMITLMGSSTNLVVHGMMLDYGLEGFSFFTLAIVGIPVTLVGFLYLFTVGYNFLPDNKGFSQPSKHTMKKYIAEVLVTNSFSYHGKSVEQAGLRDLKGLYMIKVVRGNEQISPVRSTTPIRKGDRLIFT
ncbi:MAG TPA: SLC13 family permease, partial [Bacillota bacterium]|nr:SLC13 family permease [Bacillota bacterium]